MLQDGHVVPLSLKPCKDIRKGPGIRLLSSDCPYSSREELEKSGENFLFHACNHHRALYENHANKKTCVIDGCEAEAKTVRGGLRLCKLHATKEEKIKRGGGQGPSDATQKERAADHPGETSTSSGVLADGTAACFAPGTEARPPQQGIHTEADESKGDLPYEELGQYLRLLMQGKTTGQALSEVMPLYGDPSAAWLNLRRAAAEYLPKLPDDYPASARGGIVNLLTEECPDVFEKGLDPILDLDHPVKVQAQTRRTSKPIIDPLQASTDLPGGAREAMRAFQRAAPSAPPRHEEERITLNSSSLYRQRGGNAATRPTFSPGMQTPGGGQRSHVQNLVPPRPQDSFAAVARPRHLGAYTDGEPPAMDEATKALQTIAKTLTSKDEAVNHEKGKVSSIGKVEERLVYLVRGCDALTVSVGASRSWQRALLQLASHGDARQTTAQVHPIPGEHWEPSGVWACFYVYWRKRHAVDS